MQSDMSTPTVPQCLMIGVPLVVIVGANNTGTGFSQYFAVPACSGKIGTQLTLQKEITQGACTVFTIDLEISLDGGTTWTFYAGTFDLVAIKSQPTSIQGGAIYRLNIKSFAGSGTPLVNVTVLIG